MGKFYITTPIYYVNDRPHIGHAYTTIVADVIARFHRVCGDEVFFLTGTDENSQKNVDAAKKSLGRDTVSQEEMRQYLDEMSVQWQRIWDSLGITFDRFIRTTEPSHHQGVIAFIKSVEEAGDIYEGNYEGWYCAGCEEFKTEQECPLHQVPLHHMSEKNYFFRLSKYQQKLLDHIKAHPEFIQPEARRNEVVSYIERALADVSISREGGTSGIPWPGNGKHVVYVWFDALVNYLTGIGFGNDETLFKTWWPADLHLVGKDIIKFHCALWPAMLMSAGLPLPKQIFAHGFFTVEGQKISKSLGNAVDPVELATLHGNDVLRYFLLREIPFGEDGEFSRARLLERYNGDLANGLGNLVARTLGMIEQYCEGRVPAPAKSAITPPWSLYSTLMQQHDIHGALLQIWHFQKQLDNYIDTEQPWKIPSTETDRLHVVLYNLSESLRHLGRMLWPFMPETADAILGKLGVLDAERARNMVDTRVWGLLPEKTIITKGEALFPRLDTAL